MDEGTAETLEAMRDVIGRTNGDALLMRENTTDSIVESIRSYVESLREALGFEEKLPASNCTHEINN